jgi:hypothetical protein
MESSGTLVASGLPASPLLHLTHPQVLSRVQLLLVSDPFLKALAERVNPRRDTPLGRMQPEAVRNQARSLAVQGLL